MKSQADKPQENKDNTVANDVSHIQASTDVAFQFVNNRAETMRMRTLQAMVDSSPRMVAQRLQTSGLFVSVAPSPVDKALQMNAEVAAVQRVENEDPLQRKFASDSPAQLEQQSATKPNNTGLPHNLKSGIENLSGLSMDNVKVHYNSSQPAQLNALAYAQGTDIHIAPGQEQHLPHEAWHVVQQAQGRVKPTIQMKGGIAVNDDKGLEQEADVMGRKALQHTRLGHIVHPNHDPVVISSVTQKATVVRGGTCESDQFIKGAESIDKEGKLSKVSTSSDLKYEADLNTLGNTVFNKKIGVSTTDIITKKGGACTPTPSKYNKWHTDLDGLTGEEAASVFKVEDNPNPKQF